MRFCVSFMALWFIVFSDARSQVYLTKESALDLYFPQANVERRTMFLTDEQVGTIQNTARAKVSSRLVTYYVGRTNEGVVGYAFFDTHVVRTMPETFMTVLQPDGSIRAVEILAFYEPEDYLPPKRWLATLEEKTIQSDLWLKRGVQNIVGATLSARAITDAVRVMLAVFEHAVPKEQ
ncbi:MAG: FMN-binding protein [Bacteroidota bacterium]